MKILISYGTDLTGINGNLSLEIGDKIYPMFINNETSFFSRRVEGNGFEFYPPKGLEEFIKSLNLGSNDKIFDIYSTCIWDAIGRKHKPWERGSPPEFLIELPPNATGNKVIEKEKKLDRGILTPRLDTVGEISYKNFIKLIPLPNYHPVFISCNDEYINEERNPEVRKKLLAEELANLIRSI